MTRGNLIIKASVDVPSSGPWCHFITHSTDEETEALAFSWNTQAPHLPSAEARFEPQSAQP